MASFWTRDELLSLHASWKAALFAASTGKSYQIGDRTLSRQDVPAIRAELDRIEGQLADLDGVGRLHFVTARPRR